MLAVATPSAPTFSEHFNPSLLIGVLTTNPTTGVSFEERMTIREYLEEYRHDDMTQSSSEFAPVSDIMKAFDIDGYYATSHTTIFPLTDNSKTS